MVKQHQVQQQTQTLSPQMIQSMNILQMGIHELEDYLQEVLQENPVLELPEPEDPAPPAEEFRRKLEWLTADDRQNSHYHIQDVDGEQGDPLASVGCFVDGETDLSRYILSQFMGTELEPQVMAAVEFLVSRLDPNGLLDEDLSDLSRAAGMGREVMERALIELQAADPAGVGARSLSECLRLQIERRAGDHRLAIEIAEKHLDGLAHNHYSLISRELNAPEREVRTACALIRSLNPRPGAGFAARENLAYITPDVEVTVTADHFSISTNEPFLLRLTVSAYYCGLLKKTEDREVREYLSAKLEQAQRVVNCVDQRRTTLLRLTEWIVQSQTDFFYLGRNHLRPLTMTDAAQALGVHNSTISRTVKDKYLQCSWGVYPMSWFFSRPVGTKEISGEAAKAQLRTLIEKEDRPLSDQKLCEELARRGCVISRRTVAKYREELGIPNATGRSLRSSYGHKKAPSE